MIPWAFRKKKQRIIREKIEVGARYVVSFDEDEIVDHKKDGGRAILDDISKKGIKLTVTPIFDRTLMKQMKSRPTYFSLQFRLPPDDSLMQVKGLLRWASNRMEIFPAVTELGMEFLSLTSEQKMHIHRFLTWKKR